MEASVEQRLHHAMEFAWRRRFYFLVPFVVSIPLSIWGSAMLPERYTARALLFFEHDSNDPLQSRSHGYRPRPPSLHDEISTLLRSGHILDPALKKIMGLEYPKTSRQQALARERLRDSLSVGQIGRSFYEFSIKGSDPKALGQKLEVVTSLFLESLLMGKRGPASSVQTVLAHHKMEMQKAERAVERVEREIREQDANQNKQTQVRKLQEISQRLEAKEQDLATAGLAIHKAPNETVDGLPAERASGQDSFAQPIKGKEQPQNGLMYRVQERIKSILALRSALALKENLQTPDAKTPLAQSPKIYARLAKYDRLQAEIDQLAAERRAIETSIADKERKIEAAKRLKQRLEETTVSYNSYLQRYANSIRTDKRPLELVGSPDNIKIVDPPKEPKFADVSRTMYAMAGILAGFLVGCGAALASETFDKRLRRPEQFVAILGAPVICRLPMSHGVGNTLGQGSEAAPTIHDVTPKT